MPDGDPLSHVRPFCSCAALHDDAGAPRGPGADHRLTPPPGCTGSRGVRTLIVTGTGTDVGKTVVVAAIAALARAAGERVTVVKPAQTGVGPAEDGDLAEVVRLAGARRHRRARPLPRAARPGHRRPAGRRDAGDGGAGRGRGAGSWTPTS